MGMGSEPPAASGVSDGHSRNVGGLQPQVHQIYPEFTGSTREALFRHHKSVVEIGRLDLAKLFGVLSESPVNVEWLERHPCNLRAWAIGIP